MSEELQVIIFTSLFSLIAALCTIIVTKLWEASLKEQNRNEEYLKRAAEIRRAYFNRPHRQPMVLRDIKHFTVEPPKTYPKPNQFIMEYLYGKLKKGVGKCLKTLEIL